MWITNKSLNDPNEERQNWLYLALRRAIINCLLSFATKNKLQSHGKVCKNKIFCGIVMPSPKDNIVQFIQYMKAIKCYTFIMLKLNLWLKNRWMCKQPRKIFSNKNMWTYSSRIFNVNYMGFWYYMLRWTGKRSVGCFFNSVSSAKWKSC